MLMVKGVKTVLLALAQEGPFLSLSIILMVKEPLKPEEVSCCFVNEKINLKMSSAEVVC